MTLSATASAPVPTSRARTRELVWLGLALARRGLLVRIALGVAVLTAIAGALVALRVSRQGEQAPLGDVCAVSSAALAWGAGVLVAFAASAQALRRDRTSGTRALLRARGASSAGYATARVAGLTALLVLVVGGGTFAVGITGVLAASRAAAAARVAQATAASLLYSLAFAATLAPMAMAALGARSRAGGYVWLLALLVLPELFVRASGDALPVEWREVASVPTALGALRNALMPAQVDLARFARAAFVLAVVAAACVALVRKDIVRVDAEEREGRA